MRIETFDHVALWVADRPAFSAFAVERLGLRAIEETDRFTLLGADARRGKLTLFDAEGAREPGPLVRIGLRVRDLDEAVSRLATGSFEREGATAFLHGPEGLGLALVEGEAAAEVDLDHVRFRVPDPVRSAAAFRELGLVEDGGRLRAADAWVDLEPGESSANERPLLNHLGFRVESADEHLAEAERLGLEIADVVDAPNTLAVFVQGPDGVKLEYVEHKPSFSLV